MPEAEPRARSAPSPDERGRYGNRRHVQLRTTALFRDDVRPCMVVYAEFKIPADAMRIGRAFSSLPGVRVELDRIVPLGETVVPFLWVRGAAPEDVIRVTRADGALERISVLNREGDWSLFRVEWNRKFRDAMVHIAEADMALLSGVGTPDEWWFELRASNRGPLSVFRDYLRSSGVPMTVVGITEVNHERERRPRGLTDPQLEAVRLAYTLGYFGEPRGVTLETLAREVGISRQAFSGRLKRGIENILADTLPESET